MNIVTTSGKPSSVIPSIGTMLCTKARLSVISQQITENEKVRGHVKSLMGGFSARQAWEIYYVTKRLLIRKRTEKGQKNLVGYMNWLERNL